MMEATPGQGPGEDMTLGAPPARKARRKKESPRHGITVRRFFTEPDVHPFDELEWEIRSAAITDETGKAIFEQKDVEMPATWSQLATNVVVSKYFKGPIGTPQREHSLKQLIGRVTRTITGWGIADEYFATDEDARAFEAELTYLLVNQYGSFNSPVWFNVGVDAKPQASACFIQSVQDDMSSIMDLAKNEVMLFKYGSGTGSNLSNIRSSKEHLAGGGMASGPVSFMRGYDSFAGVIKCLTPDAYIYTDEGLRQIGEVVRPGLEPGFHDDSSVVLATKDGPTRISHVYVSPRSETFRASLGQTGVSLRGTAEHPVLTLTPAFQLAWKRLGDLAAGDRVAVARGMELWPRVAPSFEDFRPVEKSAKKHLSYPTEMTLDLARLLGYMVSEGSMDAERFRFSNADEDVFQDFLACVRSVFGVDPSHNTSARVNPNTGVTTWQFEACWTNAVRFLQHIGLTFAPSAGKAVPWSIRRSPRSLVVEFLRAYFEGDGHVSTHVFAASASEQLMREVQLLLLNMGIVGQLRPHRVGDVAYWQLTMRGEQAWLFVREVGFISERKRHGAHFAGDKNTNVDVVPFLVDVLRSHTHKNGYFHCADGQARMLGFGFFNRKPGSGISYDRLRSTPHLVENARMVDPALGETLEAVLAGGFFWDTVTAVEAAEAAVTYDFTVPGTHSFIANGIVNHNSGGKTRRAAKMVILNTDHPDVEEFINCKAEEEKKAWALIEAGYDGGFNVPGGAYDSIQFQNANNSVRASDAFMRAVESDGDWTTHFVTTGEPSETFKARELMRQIAEAAWVCGDPGMQFDTTINDWHTCPNTAPINASNPCCITGDTLIAVADGRNAVAIRDLVGSEVPVYAHNHGTGRTVVSRMWNIGVKRHNAPVYRVTLDDGSTFRATDDHLIMLRDGSYRMVRDLKASDSLMPFHSKVLAPAENRTRRRHYWTGRSWQPQYRAVWEVAHGAAPAGHHIHHRDYDALNDALDNLILMPAEEHTALHGDRMRGEGNPARRMTDAWRQHISDATRGERNPNYGHHPSEETRAQMRERSAQRWANPAEHERSGASIKAGLARAKAEGRTVGRPRGERYDRCCPVCRSNFQTPRIEQIFCSAECRYSPMGRQMVGEKTAASNRGRALSATHRARLSESVRAASDPDTKRRAALTAHHNTILRAARLLMDKGLSVSVEDWDGMRAQAHTMGIPHVPTADTVARHFASDAELQEQAALYNHKVASVEFCGYEDVYDGTVDTHHNFAILTSEEASCAAGASNYSGIFIHNSEYMFLDDSACNLASLNLMKYRDDEGSFDVDAFCHAVSIFILAQEIIVGNASYPTPAIARNSYDYRPLGLGYANLGALLMARGVPYDSAEGRALCGAVTALMTGQAYKTSAQIAAHTGPFAGYAPNREPCLRVIKKHGDAVDTIDPDKCPEDLLDAARSVWSDAYALASEHGVRNAQVTVLAPTGTIAFFMDCDTTGIEPDIALVKYKKLVGGGLLKIVNNTVPEALRKLGYSGEEVSAIIDYIDQNDTIEGAPGLAEEHLPVFDCAFKPANGVRSIPYMGHVRMMAAAQPFISGAISKTTNMPNSATAEEIANTYMEAWRMGLKAIAIYRDGCKRTQPLNTSKDAGSQVSGLKSQALLPEARPMRRRLPDERLSYTHKFSVAGHEGYITVGLYEDNTPGEVFITISKEGSVVSGMMDAFATAISLNLQYGVPLEVLVKKFSHMRFEPSGFTNNKQIPIAKSIVDYIFRWMALKFMPEAEQPSLPLEEPAPAKEPKALVNGNGKKNGNGLSNPGLSSMAGKPLTLADRENLVYQTQSDAPPCPECGTIMTRSGSCYRCINCGGTSGCS